MDFGKLQDIRKVDFSLPSDDPCSSLALRRGVAPPEGADRGVRAFVGCPAWGGAASWWGGVYPKEAKAPDLLKFYATQFNSIELNTTAYRIPDEVTIQRWRSQIGPRFLFCPKFPQEITHELELSGIEALEKAHRFASAVRGLGSHLGPSLLQLGPSFAPHQLPILSSFLSALPKGFQVSVEFRHPAWFRNQRLRDDAWRDLHSHGVGTVITDVAGRRDVCHSSLTTRSVFVRFVGNSLHPTDLERIDAWASRLARWIEQGLKEIYFFVHQPGEEVAPQTVSRVIAALNLKCKLDLIDWRAVPKSEQMSFF